MPCSECGDVGDVFVRVAFLLFFSGAIVKSMLFHGYSGIGGVVVVVGMMVWY